MAAWAPLLLRSRLPISLKRSDSFISPKNLREMCLTLCDLDFDLGKDDGAIACGPPGC